MTTCSVTADLCHQSFPTISSLRIPSRIVTLKFAPQLKKLIEANQNQAVTSLTELASRQWRPNRKYSRQFGEFIDFVVVVGVEASIEAGAEAGADAISEAVFEDSLAVSEEESSALGEEVGGMSEDEVMTAQGEIEAGSLSVGPDGSLTATNFAEGAVELSGESVEDQASIAVESCDESIDAASEEITDLSEEGEEEVCRSSVAGRRGSEYLGDDFFLEGLGEAGQAQLEEEAVACRQRSEDGGRLIKEEDASLIDDGGGRGRLDSENFVYNENSKFMGTVLDDSDIGSEKDKEWWFTDESVSGSEILSDGSEILSDGSEILSDGYEIS
jgi:hypothetical protein